MSAQKTNNYPNRERRTCPNNGACLDHAGIIERVYTNQKDIDAFKRKGFVTFSTFKWTIGLLVSTLVSLFGISIYISIDVKDKVNDIRTKQETTLVQLVQIKDEIDDLKQKP